jgi:DNA-directed RNA polymerase subunit M/transcription elongation factor TFIIS
MYYYTRISEKDGNMLSYHCRNCGNTEDVLTEGFCVIDTNVRKNEQVFHHIINEYTKLDPSLPRIYTIPCPNAACKTNLTGDNATKREIIYMRYDDMNLKYLYICAECDTVWKTNN